MTEDNKTRILLQGWKEIAEYLDVSIRTCIRYDVEIELPVYRLDESKRARIHAYADELDQWREKRLKNNSESRSLKKFPLGIASKKWRLFPFIGLLIFISVLFAKHQQENKSQPKGFRIDRSYLVILDDDGKELWRKDTHQLDLNPDVYKSRSQNKTRSDNNNVLFPAIIIQDINGDKKSEILFSIQTKAEFNEERLFCYSHTGQELWHYDVGKTVKIGNDVFSSPYRIKGFVLHDYDADGREEIFLIGIHRPHFPCQLLILDCEGKQISEYWNAGYISDIVFLDITGDGKEELLVSGQNEEYLKGFLCGFKIDNIRGYSPQVSGQYKSETIGRGSQLFYLLFPRTEEGLLLSINEAIASINIYRAGQIELTSYYSNLSFVLDYSLNPTALRTSHGFEAWHSKKKREGLISHNIDEEFKSDLLDKILYWRDSKWVSSKEFMSPSGS